MDTHGVRQLGSQYLLIERVGRGGMGEVWRGTDSHGQPRAFKLLLPHFSEEPDVVRRFFAERQVLASIRHPNVVGVHDLVVEGTTLAIVMDWVEGQDLRRYVRERGTLASGLACWIVGQVALGLSAVHAAHIVHRDVKPENILLDLNSDSMKVKLTDFGVSKVIEESDAPTPTAIAGTPAYMAPEIINGQPPTAQSDLYALGIVLYELLCGLTPFAGMSSGPTLHAHLAMDPGRPEGLDDRVWQLIVQLTSKNPALRGASAAAIAVQLESLAYLTQGIQAQPKLNAPPGPVATSSQAPLVTSTQVIAPFLGSLVPGYPIPVAGYGDPADAQMLPTIQGQSESRVQPTGPGQPMMWATPPPTVNTATHASYMPPPAPSPAVYPSKPTPSNRTPVLVGIAIGLAVILAALVAYLVLGGEADRQSVEAPATAGQQSVPSGQSSSGSPAPSGPSTAPTGNTTPVVWPPANAALCPGTDEIAVNSVTSCQFAANVASEFRRHGEGEIEAYSPVTQKHYTMSCAATQASVVVCQGGIDAQVWIRR